MGLIAVSMYNRLCLEHLQFFPHGFILYKGPRSKSSQSSLMSYHHVIQTSFCQSTSTDSTVSSTLSYQSVGQTFTHTLLVLGGRRGITEYGF